MKKVIVALVAVLALVFGVSVALGDNGNTQTANLGQVASATSSASNTGTNEWSKTKAVAVASNDASVDQQAGQFSDGATNTNGQTAGLLQVATAKAEATQTGGEDDNYVTAKAIADNDASIHQGAWQAAFWGTTNTNAQDATGIQAGGAMATASNMGGDDQKVKAFSGAFNDGWICQTVWQLAFP